MAVAVTVLPLAGVAFGVFALRQPQRRRGTAIAGLVLNGLILLVVAALALSMYR